ncbi:hypothetical protein HRbin36_00486 [bacterium HR36]|nr:hypothetical protein HRbin36_00486 [bacterium HR36]
MTAAPRPYDFRQPQPEPPEVRRQVLAWLVALTNQWADLGRRHWAFPWQLCIASLRRCYLPAVFQELPDNLLCYSVYWSNRAASLLAVSRPLALGLTLALLGEKCDNLPSDRPLTDVELSLWEYILEQRLLATARICWSSEPTPQWQRGPRESTPQLASGLRQHNGTTSAVPGAEAVVMLADLQTEPPLHEGRILWLLTEAVIQEFFPANRAASAPPVSPQDILQEIPLQLVVQLGQTHLPLAQLEQLRGGDVLLLEQRLDEPLVVFLEDQPGYLAWPGRLGTQRAIQIATSWEA